MSAVIVRIGRGIDAFTATRAAKRLPSRVYYSLVAAANRCAEYAA